MSTCVRFVDSNLNIFERFIGFFDVSGGQGAEQLFNLIIFLLKELNIHKVPMMAQSYDGANVMSGTVSSVQTRIRDTYSAAIYIHCLAHKLNLVLCSTCNHIKILIFFFY